MMIAEATRDRKTAGRRFVPRHLWWAAAALFCIFAFLFAPKTQGSDCIQPIAIFGAVKLVLNCDSRLLAKLYRDAEKYFTEFNNWKGRPVFFLYGVASAPVFQAVAAPLWTALKPFASSDRSLSHFGKYFSLHLAHYTLNIAAVLVAVWMAIGLLGLDPSSRLALFVSAAIASSDLVHGSVWLAHTNIFNLSAAVATAFYFRIGYQHRLCSHVALFSWALGAGLMVLVYPVFVLLLPAFVAGVLFAAIAGRPEDRAAGPSVLATIAGVSLCLLLPVIAWNLAVKTVFATPVYLTAQYGQFVWLFDAFGDGRLGQALVDQGAAFVGTLFKHLSWFETALPLAGVVLVLATGTRDRLTRRDPVTAAILTAMIGVLSFNYLQGYYAARLQVGVAVLGYLLLAHFGRLCAREGLATGVLGCVVLAQIVDAMMHYPASAD